MKLKKYLIKNLKKCLIMSKKDTVSKKDTISKKRYHIKKKIPYQKKDTISKKRYHIKKKLIKNLKNLPYQGILNECKKHLIKNLHKILKKDALPRNLIKNLKAINKTRLRVY